MEPSLDTITDIELGVIVRAASIHRQSLINKLNRLGESPSDKKERTKVLDEVDSIGSGLAVMQECELHRINAQRDE